jgi:hypothetical protein
VLIPNKAKSTEDRRGVRGLPPDPIGKNWRKLTDEEIKKTPISLLYRRLELFRRHVYGRDY